MPDKEEVQLSVRVSPETRALIKAYGGLTYIVRRFLMDNKPDKEMIQVEMDRLKVERAKIDIEIAGVQQLIDALDDRQGGTKSTAPGSQNGSARPPQKKRDSSKVQSSKDWEKTWKPYFMMLHSAGRLSEADKSTIMRKMRLRPPATPEEWIYSDMPEAPLIGTLEVFRHTLDPKAVSLYSLMTAGRINERLYAFLVKWLGFKTSEEVDEWIMQGVEAVQKESDIAEAGREEQTAQPIAAQTEQGTGDSTHGE